MQQAPKAKEVEPQTTAGSRHSFVDMEFSQSVNAVRNALASLEAVTAAEIAVALQDRHPGYGDGLFTKVRLHPQRGRKLHIDEWLGRVRECYDLERVGQTRHQLVDGELTIAALSKLDPDFAEDLEADGFLEALTAKLEVQPSKLEQQVEQQPVQTARPTVWLLHYKQHHRPSDLLMRDDVGEGIEWRSKKVIRGMAPDDPVVYWRDVNDETGERGGLVGTGQFLGGAIRSTEEYDRSREKMVTWHYYPTRFVDLRPNDVLARDPLIESTGLDLNWSFGSILRVPPAMAESLDAYLKSHGRTGLFAESETTPMATQIAFIGDSPKSEEDFLNRAELAFVLAARLNAVWDETNNQKVATRGEAETDEWVESGRWTGRFYQQKKPVPEGGFVVHIDAPWGGGKTTFTNYLLRILNPYRDPDSMPEWLTRLPLDDVRFWPEAFHRPWYVVTFNAWRHQHVDPPWWCFYQAIRKDCFKAVRSQVFPIKRVTSSTGTDQSGNENVFQIPPALPAYSFGNACERFFRWLAFWAWELCWRLFNPKVLTLLLTFALTWIAALVLHHFGVFKPTALKDALGGSLEELPAALATALIILLGGATAIWSVFATVTESLLPGTPDAAKNYSLGSGDPLDRFRVHFDRMMRHLKRPVIVVVDDIDRCAPDFVVELLRGMQTILRSPRVMFVLLGDRDWIEHAFAKVHDSMKGINVGPEHGFGARFVEKAIQLSLVLPDISRTGRTEYVRTLLGAETGLPPRGTEALPKETAEKLEADLERLLSIDDPLNRDIGAKSLRESIHVEPELNDQSREAAVKQIDRQLALRSAADEKVQRATQHRLVPIASVLPANPRQIKRIINGISLFQEVARIEQEIQPGSADWRKLALWVVIMTEWPRTWLTLSRFPGLVDLLHESGASRPEDLPSRDQVKNWTKAIRANTAIMELIDFKGVDGQWPHTPLDTAAVKRFRAFMPATSGELLPEPEEAEPGPEAPETA